MNNELADQLRMLCSTAVDTICLVGRKSLKSEHLSGSSFTPTLSSLYRKTESYELFLIGIFSLILNKMSSKICLRTSWLRRHSLRCEWDCYLPK